MHIDKYGRTWVWTPIHDMNNALALSMACTEFGVETDFTVNHPCTTVYRRPKSANDEPYLLKTATGWDLYVRTGEDPLARVGPIPLDPRVLSLMLDMHKNELADAENLPELNAYSALVANAGASITPGADDVPGYSTQRSSAMYETDGSWRDFLEMWTHDGALQTFNSREQFRKEARALLDQPSVQPNNGLRLPEGWEFERVLSHPSEEYRVKSPNRDDIYVAPSSADVVERVLADLAKELSHG